MWMPAADQQTPRVYWPWAERTGGELSTAAVLKSGWPAGCSTPHSKHLPHHLFFLFSKNYVCCCEYRDRQWIFVYVNHNLITFLNPLMNSNNLSIESLGFSAYKVTSAVSNGSLFFFFSCINPFAFGLLSVGSVYTFQRCVGQRW